MKVILKVDDIRDLRDLDDFSAKLIKLVDSGFSEIEVDMKNVTHISSMALGSIVASHQKMASAGRKLVISNLNEEMKKLMAGTKFLDIIQIA